MSKTIFLLLIKCLKPSNAKYFFLLFSFFLNRHWNSHIRTHQVGTSPQYLKNGIDVVQKESNMNLNSCSKVLLHLKRLPLCQSFD